MREENFVIFESSVSKRDDEFRDSKRCEAVSSAGPFFRPAGSLSARRCGANAPKQTRILADPENIKYLLQRALPLLNISAPFPGTPVSQGK